MAKRVIGLMAVVAVAVICLPALGQTTTSAAVQRIAQMRLAGPIEERPSELQLFPGAERARCLRDLLGRIDLARKDASVVALVIELDGPELGWAQVAELRQALGQFREAGKKVYCFVEHAGPTTYMLAASADHIAMPLSGMVMFPGVYGEAWYFAGLLAKLGLEADMEHVGPYKGAAEPWTRTEPSDQAKEQFDWLADDIYDQMVSVLAESRHLGRDRAVAAVDRGWMMADQAEQLGLIDELAYQQAFYERVSETYGPGAELVRGYGEKEGGELDLSSPFAFFKLLSEVVKTARAPTKPVVAVVYIDGMLVSGKSRDGLLGVSVVGSTTIRKLLEQVREDESVKAVVLRIDSPGGSALASDIMFNAAVRCGQTKPLIASMGNIAASGGYYVAVSGREIVAQPNTITGSIGVVGGKLVLGGLLEKIGITTYSLQRGRHAGLFSTTQRFTDSERSVIRDLMERVYRQFVDRVVRGRGDRLKGDIEDLAGGRLYTGRQALARGLVDRAGGLADAVALAAERAGVSEYELRVLPPPKTLVNLICEMLGMEPAGGGAGVDVGRSWLPADWVQATARRLDNSRAACLGRLLQRVELLGQENVLTVMPYEVYWP
ncbi:MAG TPA: signal peptide peptidase SppA [Phycisphaerae bacterium]|nr:signal peptide peptidase SppA [Phycisphaerae bacterium]